MALINSPLGISGGAPMGRRARSKGFEPVGHIMHEPVHGIHLSIHPAVKKNEKSLDAAAPTWSGCRAW